MYYSQVHRGTSYIVYTLVSQWSHLLGQKRAFSSLDQLGDPKEEISKKNILQVYKKVDQQSASIFSS